MPIAASMARFKNPHTTTEISSVHRHDKFEQGAKVSAEVENVVRESNIGARQTSAEHDQQRGTKHSIFLPRLNQWKQTWVDNEGSYLNFTGEFKDGQMILAREALAPDGSRFLQRMVWEKHQGQRV